MHMQKVSCQVLTGLQNKSKLEDFILLKVFDNCFRNYMSLRWTVPWPLHILIIFQAKMMLAYEIPLFLGYCKDICRVMQAQGNVMDAKKYFVYL